MSGGVPVGRPSVSHVPVDAGSRLDVLRSAGDEGADVVTLQNGDEGDLKKNVVQSRKKADEEKTTHLGVPALQSFSELLLHLRIALERTARRLERRNLVDDDGAELALAHSVAEEDEVRRRELVGGEDAATEEELWVKGSSASFRWKRGKGRRTSDIFSMSMIVSDLVARAFSTRGKG